MKVVSIPTVSSNFASGVRKVFDALQVLGSEAEVKLDLSRCKFVNPAALLPFVALLRSSGYDQRIHVNPGIQTASYLETIRFPEGFEARDMNESELANFLSRYKYKSYIPIICFPGRRGATDTTRRDLLLGSVTQLMRSSLRLEATAQSAISILIAELTDNIVEHASTDHGFLVAQNYPEGGYLDICIADCGIGILGAFRRAGILVERSGQAITRAVRGMSTRGEAGRGYGISGTIGMLNDLGGRFLLISGDGTFQDTKEASFTVDNPRSIAWPGCLVIIRIPTIMPAGFNVLKYYS